MEMLMEQVAKGSPSAQQTASTTVEAPEAEKPES